MTINISSLRVNHRIHIGIGNQSIIDELEIAWSDGTSSVFHNLTPNQYYRIDSQCQKLTPLNYSINKESRFGDLIQQQDGETTKAPVASLLLRMPPELQSSDDIAATWQLFDTEARLVILR